VILTIDVSPEDLAQLQEAAASRGQDLAVYVKEAFEAWLKLPEKEVDTGYEALTELIEKCQMDTGITDLAHQHDHYLYGTPKKPDQFNIENN